MPSKKVLEEKKAIVENLTEKLKNSASGVFVDYSGISVEDDTKLRADFRKEGVEYFVAKNTLLRFAANNVGFEELDEKLNGTTALAVSANDPVAPARIVAAFAKGHDFYGIKAGFVDGRVISDDMVKDLAALPSKEVLVAKALGGFNAPLSGFVNVLNGNIRGLVCALNAIAEKQSA